MKSYKNLYGLLMFLVFWDYKAPIEYTKEIPYQEFQLNISRQIISILQKMQITHHPILQRLGEEPRVLVRYCQFSLESEENGMACGEVRPIYLLQEKSINDKTFHFVSNKTLDLLRAFCSLGVDKNSTRFLIFLSALAENQDLCFTLPDIPVTAAVRLFLYPDKFFHQSINGTINCNLSTMVQGKSNLESLDLKVNLESRFHGDLSRQKISLTRVSGIAELMRAAEKQTEQRQHAESAVPAQKRTPDKTYASPRTPVPSVSSELRLPKVMSFAPQSRTSENHSPRSASSMIHQPVVKRAPSDTIQRSKSLGSLVPSPNNMVAAVARSANRVFNWCGPQENKTRDLVVESLPIPKGLENHSMLPELEMGESFAEAFAVDTPPQVALGQSCSSGMKDGDGFELPVQPETFNLQSEETVLPEISILNSSEMQSEEIGQQSKPDSENPEAQAKNLEEIGLGEDSPFEETLPPEKEVNQDPELTGSADAELAEASTTLPIKEIADSSALQKQTKQVEFCLAEPADSQPSRDSVKLVEEYGAQVIPKLAQMPRSFTGESTITEDEFSQKTMPRSLTDESLVTLGG